MLKYSITDMQRLAQTRGGKFLSKKYTGIQNKHIWQCKEGHKWRAQPNNIKSGKWCPYCAGNVAINVEQIKKLVRDREGSLIEIKHKNGKKILTLKCNIDGTTWDTYIDVIKKGHWCRTCGINKSSLKRRKYSLETFQKIAKSKNATCLSTEYRTTKNKLQFRCELDNFIWETSADNVLSGKWCQKCARMAPVTLDSAKNIATERGGKCLSKSIGNSKERLKWKCSNGHVWSAPYSNVVHSGRWCPYCSGGIGEEMCRIIFEGIFHRPFPKCRNIPWLRNSRGNPMELDGYCDRLHLAFERHGEQHYQVRTHFIKSRKKLELRQRDDLLKKKLCKRNGVKLIIIPYTVNNLELIDFIKKSCKALGVRVPSHNRKFSLNSAYSKNGIAQMNELAKKKAGKCLSKIYNGTEECLLWECKKHHKWEATPYSVKSLGTWCPDCAGNKKITLDRRALVGLIRKLQKRIGRPPSIADWTKEELAPSASFIKTKFGSWNNAIKAAGLRPNPWGAGRTKYRSKKHLLKQLRLIAKRLGHTPRAIDLDTITDMPGKNTYIKHFGSWKLALKLAGL